MNILFVCRYNRFRSVIAEGLFRKYSRKHKAKSCGLIAGSPIDQNTKNIARKFKIRIKKKPQPISSKLLAWQDVIIIVADNVPPIIFKQQKNVKKLKVWKIRDTQNNKQSFYLAKKIDKKIKQLAMELK